MSRDTQFAGFASLVLGDMLQASEAYSGLIDSESEAWQEAMQRILARRAYDLACHVSTHTILSAHGDMNKIPDLEELPKEQ